MKKRIHIKVNGLVQGVGFRYYTIELAKQLNLTGWVRNTLDGGVEILAQGEEDNLKELLNWAYHGPKSARVENVEYKWGEYKNEFNEFKAVV